MALAKVLLGKTDNSLTVAGKCPMKVKLTNPCADRRQAFTLVECLVAGGLLTITAVSLCAGWSSGFLYIKMTREALRATEILAEKTEAVRLLTWSQLSNCPATFQEWYFPPGLDQNSAGILYSGTIDVGPATNIPDTASYKGEMRLVTVNIYWTNYNGATPIVHKRQVQTQAASSGMQNYIWGARQ
jgi:hypothetical protein